MLRIPNNPWTIFKCASAGYLMLLGVKHATLLAWWNYGYEPWMVVTGIVVGFGILIAGEYFTREKPRFELNERKFMAAIA